MDDEQQKLLNVDYLKDKNIKKVSIATLKRRHKQSMVSNEKPEIMVRAAHTSRDATRRAFMDKLNPSFLAQAKKSNESAVQVRKRSPVKEHQDEEEEEEETSEIEVVIHAQKRPKDLQRYYEL